MNYDIIGDIHGYAGALKALLASMGYHETQGTWRHADRQAVFVGDLIDRGPHQVETVNIVRRMVDAGSAQVVMGNHEFNAIAWYLPNPEQPGEYLRPHHSPKYGEKNFRQHKAFLDAVIGTPLHGEIINWFLTLPLWLELDSIRVVHGCWHQGLMNYLQPQLLAGNRLTCELMPPATREPDTETEKDSPEPSIFKAVEALTKGTEISLPHPHSFIDKDGHERRRARVRWWDSTATTYQKAVMLDEGHSKNLPDMPVPDHLLPGTAGEVPVFVGHYWLTGTPSLLSPQAACVDYSIGKGGKLVAYRWDGEPQLDATKFHWV